MTKNIKILLLFHALTGFVAWYAVEKIFLQSIGVNILQISILATSYIAVSALLNIPTGILADKLGRKSALFIASLFLAASTLLAGTANGFLQYLVAAILWGIFFTTQHGAFSAIIYDELKSNNNEKMFNKINGLSSSIKWFAIFLSSFMGAFIGNKFGLREVFYFTLIPNILCILLSLKINEPKILTKIETLEVTLGHLSMVKKGIKTLFKSKQMIKLSTLFLCIQLLSWTYNEYDQLYFIAIGFGVLGVGIINGLSGLSQAAGSYLGGKIKKQNHNISIIICLLLSAVLYFFDPKYSLLAVIVFLILIGYLQLTLVDVEANLQHQTESNVRATTMSILGMINDVIMVIAFLSFGIISQNTQVKYGLLVITVAALVIYSVGFLGSFKKSLLQTQS